MFQISIFWKSIKYLKSISQYVVPQYNKREIYSFPNNTIHRRKRSLFERWICLMLRASYIRTRGACLTPTACWRHGKSPLSLLTLSWHLLNLNLRPVLTSVFKELILSLQQLIKELERQVTETKTDPET